MKGSNKKSSGVEETKNQEESKDKEELAPSNQDQPESALQNLVETGEDGGPIKKVTGYATLKDLAMLARVNKKFQSAMNKEIKQRLPTIHSVSAGREHTMLLVKINQGQNKLFATGKNDDGQLGLGDTRDRNEWTEVLVPREFSVEEVIAGKHTFLKGKGVNGEAKLYACGRNDSGQLGLGDRLDRSEWTEVPLPDGFTIEKVIVGSYHTHLKGKGKDGEGKIYACGANRYGQLGLGDRRGRTEWTEVDLPENFKLEQFVGGGLHSFLKGTVGGEDKLYAFGYNDYGQLGLGNDERGSHQWAEVDIPRGFRLEQVAAGGAHSFLKGTVDGEAKLYACGNNASCQLGLGDSRKRNKLTAVDIPQGFSLEKVIAGSNNTFLKGKGVNGEDKLYACGSNHCGQLGLGYTPSRHELTEVTFSDGFKIEQVRAGNIFTFVKGTVGGEDMIYATGDNDYGQLGLGDRWGRAEWTEVPIRNMVLKSIVSQEEASMNKKRSGGK